MSVSIKHKFLKKAAWIALAGALFLPGTALAADDGFERSLGNGCGYPAEIKTPKTPAEQHLMSLFSSVSNSPTAQFVLDTSLRRKTAFCFNEALTKPGACGGILAGLSSFFQNRIELNPDRRISEVYRAMTLVHEGRHAQQTERGGFFGGSFEGANIPEWHIIAYEWFQEADARMISIVFAHEMEAQGRPEFMNHVRTERDNLPLVKAFEVELGKSGDMKAAMQEAVLAFRKTGKVAQRYANKVADALDEGELDFDPVQKMNSFPKALWTALGDVGPYGNYMDDEMIEAVYQTFTEKDYKQLMAVRARSGGTKGAACKAPSSTASLTN